MLYNYIFPNKNIPEKDFAEHYKKFQDVTKIIAHQTPDQVKETLKETVNGIKHSNIESIGSLGSGNFLNLVKISETKNSILAETEACVFMDHVVSLSNKITFKDKPRQIAVFKDEITKLECEPAKLIELRDRSIGLSEIAIQENPYFQNAVHNFVSSVENESFKYIQVLITYSTLDQTLTAVPFGQKLALALGFKVYVLTYYSLQNPGSLTIFLTTVQEGLADPSKINLPLKIYDAVYEKRYTIGYRIGAFLFGHYIFGGNKVPEVIEQTSRFMPKSELLSGIFDGIKPDYKVITDVARTIKETAKEVAKETSKK